MQMKSSMTIHLLLLFLDHRYDKSYTAYAYILPRYGFNI